MTFGHSSAEGAAGSSGRFPAQNQAFRRVRRASPRRYSAAVSAAGSVPLGRLPRPGPRLRCSRARWSCPARRTQLAVELAEFPAPPSAACLIDSEIRRRSRSMSMILTQSSSPGVTTCSRLRRDGPPSRRCARVLDAFADLTNAERHELHVARRARRPGGRLRTLPRVLLRRLQRGEMRSRDKSTSSTCTVTSSPTCTTDDGWSTCFQESSETWTKPSMPPRSTKAPKFTTDDTTPGDLPA